MARLLVIERDPTTAQLVHLYLSGAGHQVTEAKSYDEGLRLTGRLRPDMIVMDSGQAEPEAMEIVYQTRELENHPPVVIMTRRGCERDCRRLIRAGAAEVVIKSPYFQSSLIDKVDRILDGEEERSPEEQRQRIEDTLFNNTERRKRNLPVPIERRKENLD